MVMKRRT